MKRRFRFLSAFLAFVMLLSFTSLGVKGASAEDNLKKDSNESSAAGGTSVLTVDKLSGASASSVESLFGKNLRAVQGASPELSKLKLSYKDNKLVLQGELKSNNKIINFVSSGDMYKNEKTQNSGTYGNLLLGDMSDFDNIHFVQLRIDKDQSSVMIILQNKDTKQLMKFQTSIDNNVFNKLYDSHKNQLSGTALEKKIIALYSVTHNLVNKDTSSKAISSISPSVSTNDVHALGTSYSGWAKLISDLNASGSVNLSNYSNIDSSFFTYNGLRGETKWGTAPYTFASYGGQNGPDDYLHQFALIDITTHSYATGASGQWFTGMQAMYHDGMITDYNVSSNTLSVVYYGAGLRFNQFEIGVGPLTNKAIFINRTVNSQTETYGNWVSAAIALIDPLSTVTDMFQHLAKHVNQDKNSTLLFEETYQSQYEKNNGEVIQGIEDTTGDDFISKSGEYINVYGIIKYNENTNWTYGYNFTTYNDL